MNDELGSRMKEQYENRTRFFLPRRTYTILRLDGKAFHSYTRFFRRPFDPEFATLMDDTAMYLLENIQGAKFSYTQSDEISILITDFDDIKTDMWFNGNIQKIVSVSASMAGAFFNRKNKEFASLACFDARIFTIPDPTEVKNYFIWRQKDAIRNSLQMVAQSHFSHKELNGKSNAEQHEMIHQKGDNWANYPNRFKNGQFIYKSSGIFVRDDKLIVTQAPFFDHLIPEYK